MGEGDGITVPIPKRSLPGSPCSDDAKKRPRLDSAPERRHRTKESVHEWWLSTDPPQDQEIYRKYAHYLVVKAHLITSLIYHSFHLPLQEWNYLDLRRMLKQYGIRPRSQTKVDCVWQCGGRNEIILRV